MEEKACREEDSEQRKDVIKTISEAIPVINQSLKEKYEAKVKKIKLQIKNCRQSRKKRKLKN